MTSDFAYETDEDETDLGAQNEIEAVLNGRPAQFTARSSETLVDVLRGQGLWGTREGCGVGMCGACTVLLDGEAQSGCLVLAPLVDGRAIETIEGLEGPNGDPDEVQRAFLKHTAFQCSYCTSGFILMTKRLLDEYPEATRSEAAEYLSGNLCRCGSYVKILDAVEDLLASRKRARADMNGT